jgi:hypothetical protein
MLAPCAQRDWRGFTLPRGRHAGRPVDDALIDLWQSFQPPGRPASQRHVEAIPLTSQLNDPVYPRAASASLGAAPDRFMTHLAMQQVDDRGNTVTWGQHVTDDEYNAAPAAPRKYTL